MSKLKNSLSHSLAAVLVAALALPAFAGPKVTIVGDSYSTFSGVTYSGYNCYYPANDVLEASQTYWMQFITAVGGTLEVCNAYSGSRVTPNDANCMIGSRLDNLGSPDIVLICGGTNDSGFGVGLGESIDCFDPANLTGSNLNYFRPAFSYLVKEVIARCPGAQIMVIANSFDDWVQATTASGATARHGITEEYANSIAEIAAHYGVGFVQLYGISKNNGHPTAAGMTAFANQLLAAYNAFYPASWPSSGAAVSTDANMKVYDLGNNEFAYEFDDPTAAFKLHLNADATLLEYLVVGGGAGGGSTAAGGGGAGGFVTAQPNQALTAGSDLAITVGAGGLGAYAERNCPGYNGVCSTLKFADSTIVAYGGGAGGGFLSGYGSNVGHNGASGGGGGNTAGGGSSIYAGQGNAGGSGNQDVRGGGGGGAGSAGLSYNDSTNPSGGGAGLSSSITGEPKMYAAGGGGGARADKGYNAASLGGSEIGGNGGTTAEGADAVANTGSGGGGGGFCNNGLYPAGGKGSAGTIIVKLRVGGVVPSEDDLANCSVTFDPDSPVEFTGSAIDVHYTVTAPGGETELEKDTDYTASWSSTPIQAVGTYTLTLTAAPGSDYTGSKTATFEVAPESEATDADGQRFATLAAALKEGTPPFALAKDATLDPADVGPGSWAINANGFALTLLPSSSLAADYSGGILTITRLTNRFAIKPDTTFAEKLGAGTLENFPILVRLSEAIDGFDYDDVMEGGADLKFYDANDNRIPYEIELWDTTGTSYVWVKVPELAADTVIYVEYGDAATTDNDPTAVWSKYVIVVHGGSEIKNSSGSGLTAASGDATYTIPTTDPCVVGGGISKTAMNTVGINVQNPAKNGKLSGSQITVSCWHKPNITSTSSIILFAIQSANDQIGCSAAYRYYDAQHGTVLQVRSKNSVGGNPVETYVNPDHKLDPNNWHLTAFKYDWSKNGSGMPESNPSYYYDGVGKTLWQNPCTLSFTEPGNDYWSFGSYANNATADYNYAGLLDELRIYDGIASAKWLEIEYAVEAGECFTYEAGVVEPKLSDCTVAFTPASPAVLSGAAITPVVTVTAPDGVTELVENTHYTASWDVPPPFNAAGTYTLTLTAKSGSGYVGSKTATFVVTSPSPSKPITLGVAGNNVTITLAENSQWAGKSLVLAWSTSRTGHGGSIANWPNVVEVASPLTAAGGVFVKTFAELGITADAKSFMAAVQDASGQYLEYLEVVTPGIGFVTPYDLSTTVAYDVDFGVGNTRHYSNGGFIVGSTQYVWGYNILLAHTDEYLHYVISAGTYALAANTRYQFTSRITSAGNSSYSLSTGGSAVASGNAAFSGEAAGNKLSVFRGPNDDNRYVPAGYKLYALNVYEGVGTTVASSEYRPAKDAEGNLKLYDVKSGEFLAPTVTGSGAFTAGPVTGAIGGGDVIAVSSVVTIGGAAGGFIIGR